MVAKEHPSGFDEMNLVPFNLESRKAGHIEDPERSETEAPTHLPPLREAEKGKAAPLTGV